VKGLRNGKKIRPVAHRENRFTATAFSKAHAKKGGFRDLRAGNLRRKSVSTSGCISGPRCFRSTAAEGCRNPFPGGRQPAFNGIDARNRQGAMGTNIVVRAWFGRIDPISASVGEDYRRAKTQTSSLRHATPACRGGQGRRRYHCALMTARSSLEEQVVDRDRGRRRRRRFRAPSWTGRGGTTTPVTTSCGYRNCRTSW